MAEWGYVKISRKAYAENDWWGEPRVFSKWEAWEDCIQMAAWQPRHFVIGHVAEQLERGEFQASVRFLAKRWRWGKHVVEKFLEGAKKRGRLLVQREGKGGTVYLLVNYEMYQGEEPETGTPNGTQPGTPRGHLGDKSKAVKAVKHRTDIRDLSTDEAAVIAHYREQHPKRMRGEVPSRTVQLLRHALESYTVEELNRAIDANAASEYHRKGNFMDLSLIVRDSEHIDRFLGMAAEPQLSVDNLTWVD